MIEKLNDPQPPRGLKRFLFRLPIWLYHIRCGWLLGQRFTLINHIGRKSGLSRQVVVEVVRHDVENQAYIVASGFGKNSHWYRNLQETPHTTIVVGRRKYTVQANFLTPVAGADEMADYARRHPATARNLAQLMGYRIDGTEADYRALGEQIPFVALRY